MTLLASARFSPWQFRGMLQNSLIDVNLVHVSASWSDQKADRIPMEVSGGVRLDARPGLPSGAYSVELVFSFVNQPATITFMRQNSVIGQCSVQVSISYDKLQTCDSGIFQIADGELGVWASVSQGKQLTLNQIAVNAWGARTR
ncbi:MAG: hypothetical protein ABR537_01015 [Gemmatimonadales bacterium]